ncbi:MAG TPA: imidazolonepropionase [Candidatus Acidoferrales bacterium]|nr:imidazolonepropionase [Candidatus Acidoferrales bacterium]
MPNSRRAPDQLLTNCSQILTLRGPAPRRGRALADPGIISDGALLIRDGRVAAVGPRRPIERLPESRRAGKLDLAGRVVIPGFVDSHTHLVHPCSRAAEYEQRISGATYEEIARTGGGILNSVRKLRAAPAAHLKSRALAHLAQFAAHGTTTLEAKSGYGLDWLSERKILSLVRELNRQQCLEIVPTFLGAHVVPAEFRNRTGKTPEAYIDLICREWLPRVATENLAEFCDVFCDRGAFTVAQSRKVLTAARACGLGLRLHAEQLTRTGAARLAIQMHAASADHLEKLAASDIRALAGSDVTCTMLPGCCFHLGLAHYGPARQLIDAGAIVALATDFNPGTSPTVSMPMILSLACTQMHMTPAEALAAATINAAYSLRRHDRIGSLEVGKFADLAVFDVADSREIPYYFGVNHCVLTMKRGRVIASRD